MGDTKPTVLDLFAGVGGMRLAFENAGFETVFANDFDRGCRITYDLNFEKPKLNTENIWNLDISKIPFFDVLVAGFPCQAFSIAGSFLIGFLTKSNKADFVFFITNPLTLKPDTLSKP